MEHGGQDERWGHRKSSRRVEAIASVPVVHIVRVKLAEKDMARMMNEKELLEFYEVNRRLSLEQQSRGKLAAAERTAEFTREIEKHLYRFLGPMSSEGNSIGRAGQD